MITRNFFYSLPFIVLLQHYRHRFQAKFSVKYFQQQLWQVKHPRWVRAGNENISQLFHTQSHYHNVHSRSFGTTRPNLTTLHCVDALHPTTMLYRPKYIHYFVLFKQMHSDCDDVRSQRTLSSLRSPQQEECVLLNYNIHTLYKMSLSSISILQDKIS